MAIVGALTVAGALGACGQSGTVASAPDGEPVAAEVPVASDVPLAAAQVPVATAAPAADGVAAGRATKAPSRASSTAPIRATAKTSRATSRTTSRPTSSPKVTRRATPTRTTTASTKTATTSGPTSGTTSGAGAGTTLAGVRIFPADNAWNTRVDSRAVDPNSAALIASISGNLRPDFGANWDGGPFGIPYVVVPGSQPKVPVSFDYAEESDPGPYPIPRNVPIEGGANATGDRHVIVIDKDNRKLYELFAAHPVNGGASWKAGSGAVFDLNSNGTRPAGWTSADAAGLPILPGLAKYDEVASGRITHALRFTVANTRRAYVAPARHYASTRTATNLPPMGTRVRLKASFDISGYPAQARVVLQALKTYGMILADNGSNWFVSGAPDARWNDDDLGTLKKVPGSAFEVVTLGPVTTG